MELNIDIAAIFLPLLGAAFVTVFGRLLKDRGAKIVASVAVLASAVLSVIIFDEVALKGATHAYLLGAWIESGSIKANWGLKIDTLSAVMMLVVTSVSAMVHIYSVGYMRGDKGLRRFMAYLNLFTFFMLMLVTSDNLLQMFFGWEGLGLSSYLLIGFWYDKPAANNAAMKAFLMNRVGDAGFLMGIFGCFWIFKSVEFDAIFKMAPELVDKKALFYGFLYSPLTFICVFLSIGAMGKSAQLCLHTWLPDAMEGPTPVSALIHAATMVAAGVFMIARMSPLFEYAPAALSFIGIIGALTALIAASMACVQFDIKRVIAYSTISQLGYMFFALGVSAYSAAMFHLTTHAFFKSLLFLGAGSVIHALSGEQDMRKMGGIWRKIPVTYIYMWIGSLSLSGICFSGFYSKDLILESAVASHKWFGMTVYVIGLMVAFMTSFYSWRLIIMTFHGKPKEEAHAHEAPLIMLLPLVPLALGAIFAGWYAEDLFAGSTLSDFWRQALFVLPQNDSIAAIHQLPLWQKLLPFVMAISGIILAYKIVIPVIWTPKPEKRKPKAGIKEMLRRLILNKYYFDDIYYCLFTQIPQKIGSFFWKTCDEGVIDAYGSNGASLLAGRLGKRASYLQTGYIYTYAFVMVSGLAGLVAWFCV